MLNPGEVYIPGLLTTCSKWSADSVLGGKEPEADTFVAPQMALQPRRNMARIEEIQKRLAEIAAEKKRLQDGGAEEAMAKYKFLYEGDANPYMQLQQNRRTAEETRRIREANDRNTQQANLQGAWKENNTALMTAQWDLRDAENKYAEAKASGDPERIRAAGTRLSQARALYGKHQKENADLRGRVFKSFGLEQKQGQEPENTPGLDDGTLKDISAAEGLQKALGELELLKKDVAVDNVSVSKKQKADNIARWEMKLGWLEQELGKSMLSQQRKNEIASEVADIRKAIANYGKKSGKGGQGTVSTKEDYQKALDGMTTRAQLVKMGHAWLQKAKDLGATHPDLDRALDSSK